MLDLALVGTGGMLPLPNRWLASVLVRWERHLILFDCGEGTQISLRSLGWGLKDIDLILVSHLHGDHVGGLPGLLLSHGNSGRTEPVDVVGPPGLTATVAALRSIAPYLPFEVRCRDLEGGETLSLGEMRIRTAPADHTAPCIAYRLGIARRPRFLPERARALDVPLAQWRTLQDGNPVAVGDRLVRPEDVLGPPRPGIALGLCGDTRPTPTLADLFRGVTLLVSEGTYGDLADLQKAIQRKHMTFAEAAGLARDAGAGQLLLTHFSPALMDPPAYAAEAERVFPNTIVGRDHLTLTLRFPAD